MPVRPSQVPRGRSLPGLECRAHTGRDDTDEEPCQHRGAVAWWASSPLSWLHSSESDYHRQIRFCAMAYRVTSHAAATRSVRTRGIRRTPRFPSTDCVR